MSIGRLASCVFLRVARSALDWQGTYRRSQKICDIVRAQLFKADMNSDIQLQTAAIIFVSNLYLKQGIGLVYVMVDFICKD